MLITFPRLLALTLAALAAIVPAHQSAAQCGASIAARMGGETSGVARVNANGLIVAHGSEAEMFNLLIDPLAPAHFSPARKVALDAPAVKVDMTPSTPRAFVLLANGDVEVLTVSYSPFLTIGFPVTIHTGDAVDIVADGQRVYIARQHEYDQQFVTSEIAVYDDTSGTPQFIGVIDPLIGTYAFDRIAKVGNVLWAGFHQFQSSIFGVDGFNVSTPSSPTRVGTALTNTTLDANARISAMAAVNNLVLVSYTHFSAQQNEEWLRAADVSIPTAPAWQAPADLNGFAACMSAVPGTNLLRISIKDSGVGTWDTTNPSGLAWLGAYFDSFPNVGQIVAGSGTDYWAAGRAGLMTMNTTAPASISVRSQSAPTPYNPTVVRQSGNLTVVLDYALNALRIYDLTQPEAQQLRSTFALPLYAEHLELAVLPGGVYACVSTYGNPGGDVISIIDINNPAAPATRSTVTGFRTQMMTSYGSRLYAWTIFSDLKVIDLTSPSVPAVFTTHYGVAADNLTAMTAWSNRLAMAFDFGLGVWLIDTTSASAPLVSGIWNPVSNYHVTAMAMGVNYLYISAYLNQAFTPTRLESVNVTNLAHPVQRFVVDDSHGAGPQDRFRSLTYVGTAAGKFLVAIRDDSPELGFGPGSGITNQMTIFELPPGGLTMEGVPFPIAQLPIPFGFGNVAPALNGTRLVVAALDAGLYEIATPAQWAPGFGVRPFSQEVCFASTQVTLSAIASANPTAITYQWMRDNTPVVDGPTPWGSTITGATTIALTITNPHAQDSLASPRTYSLYRCVATNTCGSTTSDWAIIRYCRADTTCDGQILPDDVSRYIATWLDDLSNGTTAADFDGNSRVEPADVSLFVAAWFDAVQHGC